MAQLLLEDHEIVQALDLKNNEEAIELIKKLLSDENLSVHGFADALKNTFNDVDLPNSTKVKQSCKEFLKHYNNQVAAAQLRAERKVCSATGKEYDYVDCIQITDKSFECSICHNNFDNKKEIKKHIKSQHKKKEIEEAFSEDDKLLSYKASTFVWPYIKKKERGDVDPTEATIATYTEEELKNQIKMDKEIKMHHRTKIKTLEKELEIAISEKDALKEAAEEESMDVTPGKNFIIMERSSSITEGAYHGTKVRLLFNLISSLTCLLASLRL